MNYPNIKDKNYFYPKFVFVFFFFLRVKLDVFMHKEKNTKSQTKKTVHETVNFDSKKLTKPKKKKEKKKRITQHFHNIFIFYFDL